MTSALDTQGPHQVPAALDTQTFLPGSPEVRQGLDVHKGGGIRRVFAFSTRGRQRHDQIRWQVGDVMLFGAETRGLPEGLLADIPEAQRVRLPMRPRNRSLNLSNAVAVAVFEGWRQLDFVGGS